MRRGKEKRRIGQEEYTDILSNSCIARLADMILRI
jgi:hypothetical protein